MTLEKSYKYIKIPRYLYFFWIVSIVLIDIEVYFLYTIKQEHRLRTLYLYGITKHILVYGFTEQFNEKSWQR